MIGIKWVGWDGSQWDLNTGNVHLTDAGIEGLGHLPAETFVQTTALLDGQRYTGWRALPRPVLLPVLIGQAATSDEWFRIDKAWWETMRPDRAGTLVVTAPDGTARSIKLRFVDDGSMPFGHDPTRDRLSVAVLSMVADDPWYLGDPFTQTFLPGTDPQNFFGGAAGFGPPFYIGSANTLGEATILNTGNIDTWPDYYVDGPIATFEATVDGSLVSASMPIAEGQQLRIETHPTRQVAYLVTGGVLDGIRRVGGVEENVTKLLESVEFAQIPAGRTVALNVAASGAGRVTVVGQPRFFRAW